MLNFDIKNKLYTYIKKPKLCMSVRTSDAAAFLGIHPQTLRKWEQQGKITPHRVNGQRRFYLKDLEPLKGNQTNNFGNRTNVIYARGHPEDDKQFLQQQLQFMQTVFPDYEVITDTSSSLNFERPGLQTLLERICKNEIGRIAIAYPDRVGRYGEDLFRKIAQIFGCEIVSIDYIKASPESELVRDVIEITKSSSERVNDIFKFVREMSNDKTLEQKETAQNLEKLDKNIN